MDGERERGETCIVLFHYHNLLIKMGSDLFINESSFWVSVLYVCEVDVDEILQFDWPSAHGTSNFLILQHGGNTFLILTHTTRKLNIYTVKFTYMCSVFSLSDKLRLLHLYCYYCMLIISTLIHYNTELIGTIKICSL